MAQQHGLGRAAGAAGEQRDRDAVGVGLGQVGRLAGRRAHEHGRRDFIEARHASDAAARALVGDDDRGCAARDGVAEAVVGQAIVDGCEGLGRHRAAEQQRRDLVDVDAGQHQAGGSAGQLGRHGLASSRSRAYRDHRPCEPTAMRSP